MLPGGLISSVGNSSETWKKFNSMTVVQRFHRNFLKLKISISIGQPFDDCLTMLHQFFYIMFSGCKWLVYINNK